jgi:hypothetical protein
LVASDTGRTFHHDHHGQPHEPIGRRLRGSATDGRFNYPSENALTG